MIKVGPLGHISFKVGGKKASLVINPFCQKAAGLEWKKRTADLILVTRDTEAFNNIGGVDGVSYVVIGPGEYEVEGIQVCGISLDGGTFYQFKIDGVTFLYLGDVNVPLGDGQLSEIGEIDILFVPVGGGSVLSAEQAVKVVAQVEPRIVIPICYQGDTKAFSEYAPVEKFIEEMGEEVERVPALKLKSRADLPEKTTVTLVTSLPLL